MKKLLGIILAGIVADLVLFPITANVTLQQNSKNVLAALGLVLLFLDMTRSRKQRMDMQIVELLLYAALFSFICFVSVVLNGTGDYTYVTYVVSSITWLCAAYSAVSVMRMVHGKLSVRLIANYLIGICVVQCVLALAIDMSPAFGDLVDSTINFGQAYYSRSGRLYGIGCALDPAGTRLGAALILCAFMILSLKKKDKPYLMPLYLTAYGIITVLGNMIARTTTIGALIGLAALLFFPMMKIEHGKGSRRVLGWLLLVIAVAYPLVSFFYAHNRNFRENIRFGFEGFFSLVETGHWETHSTNVLETMYVWPDDPATWVIGDGYMLSPYNNPYYVGDDKGIFYKNTDVGICRFIFYCGLVGLIAFAFYFAKVSQICAKRMPGYSWMFFLLFCLEIIIWFKVATDIFLVFAFFLAAGKMDGQESPAEPKRIAT